MTDTKDSIEKRDSVYFSKRRWKKCSRKAPREGSRGCTNVKPGIHPRNVFTHCCLSVANIYIHSLKLVRADICQALDAKINRRHE